MDDRGFDALTRQLATGRTRRSVLRGMIAGGAALVTAKTGSALAAKAPKVNVCHWDDDTGMYEWINISQNGWDNGHSSQHEQDFLRTDCCTDSDCVAGDVCTSASCAQGVCTEAAQPPVDCQVSDWSEWGACSNTCGVGTRVRTRTVVTEASCGGAACSALEESESCTGLDCNPNITVTFTPTGEPDYCMVYVTLDQFAPSTAYTAEYDILGFGYQGAAGNFTTDGNGDAGPTGVLSYYNQNRQIDVYVGSVHSGFIPIVCP